MLKMFFEVNWDFKTLDEVQSGVVLRKFVQQHQVELNCSEISDIYYGDNDNFKVIVIHEKFGRLKKQLAHLDEVKNYSGGKLFYEEFLKYFEDENYFLDENSYFKDELQILDYIKKHQFPIVFYQNINDQEITFDQCYEIIKQRIDKEKKTK